VYNKKQTQRHHSHFSGRGMMEVTLRQIKEDRVLRPLRRSMSNKYYAQLIISLYLYLSLRMYLYPCFTYTSILRLFTKRTIDLVSSEGGPMGLLIQGNYSKLLFECCAASPGQSRFLTTYPGKITILPGRLFVPFLAWCPGFVPICPSLQPYASVAKNYLRFYLYI